MPASPATPSKHILFAPFDLDLRAGQLRRAGTLVALRPKTFSVLVHLAEHPGELITKQALLDAVWGDVAVTEDVVRLSIGELRGVFGDARSAPRFIETVPRRGYRFVATLGEAIGAAMARAGDPDVVVVGRGSERAELLAWMGAAMSGSRQVGFVTGEAGIGKTTLVELALRELRRAPEGRLRLACGQCVEQYGGGERYMPVLEALAGLCRGPDGPAIEATLREHAPGWVLRATSTRAAGVGGAEPVGGTHEYTLHRLAVCLEALAADVALALVIEDMHWSDYVTLDLVSLLAHRRHPARLLVLCTLRQADAIVRGHPVVKVKRELVRTGSCRELALGGLPSADVEQYAAARFAGAALPVELVTLLVQRSEGSPFFMTALVQHLLDRGLVVKHGPRWELGEPIEILQAATPDGIRALIEPTAGARSARTSPGPLLARRRLRRRPRGAGIALIGPFGGSPRPPGAPVRALLTEGRRAGRRAGRWLGRAKGEYPLRAAYLPRATRDVFSRSLRVLYGHGSRSSAIASAWTSARALRIGRRTVPSGAGIRRPVPCTDGVTCGAVHRPGRAPHVRCRPSLQLGGGADRVHHEGPGTRPLDR